MWFILKVSTIGDFLFHQNIENSLKKKKITQKYLKPRNKIYEVLYH